VVTTLAAIANTPHGVCFDLFGNLLVAVYNGHQIKRVTPAGIVTNVAGSGQQGATEGDAALASFLFPRGVTMLPNGVILVADFINYAIRSINGTSVSTFAGGAVQRVHSHRTPKQLRCSH
jgi:streptogramin lyase